MLYRVSSWSADLKARTYKHIHICNKLLAFCILKMQKYTWDSANIFFCPSYYYITPVLASLHWLPIRFRVDFKLLLFVFKSLHGLAPPYLADLIQPHRPARALRSADQLLLEARRARLKTRGDRAFAVVGPNLWNALPLSVRAADSIECFKSRLKAHLFSIAFS